MLLSDYIKACQDLLDEHGDIDKFYTSIDDEGNGYNPSGYNPELRYVELSMQHSRSGRLDNLIEPPEDFETLKAWAEENCLDLEDDGTFDMTKLKKVILL